MPPRFILLAAFFAFAAAAASAQAPRGPNLLVIVADDLGYGDLGYLGSREIPTPRLDALAAQSVRCTGGYAGHPFCSPTRAGLLTGRYQQRFGHENNPRWEPGNDQVGLPLSETTLPQVLRAAGYATGLVGKWHLGAHPVFHPNRRGFDEFFGFLGGGHTYFPAKKKAGAAAAENAVGAAGAAGAAGDGEYGAGIRRNDEPVEEKEHLTHAFAREASAFIERHKAEPWFLYLAFNAPHNPVKPFAPEATAVSAIADEKRRAYAALVVGMDRAVGRVLDALRESGREQETLVFFFSDNGGPEKENGSDNGPLRGGKGEVYEGGIRVPFLIRWPGRLAPGEYAQPVTSTDIFATAATLAGVSAPTARDSVDVLPFLEGKKPGAPHERLFWRVGGSKGRLAVREGEWKWVRQDGKTELFHLSEDLAEGHDLFQAEPERAAALEKAALEWSAEMLEPRWPGLRAGKKGADAQ